MLKLSKMTNKVSSHAFLKYGQNGERVITNLETYLNQVRVYSKREDVPKFLTDLNRDHLYFQKVFD